MISVECACDAKATRRKRRVRTLVYGGTYQNAQEKLLEEGDYTRRNKKAEGAGEGGWEYKIRRSDGDQRETGYLPEKNMNQVWGQVRRPGTGGNEGTGGSYEAV